MNALASIANPSIPAPGTAPPREGRSPADFAEALNRAGARDRDAQGAVREAAEQLVAHALILPLLKSMENDPFRSEMFHGGQAEKAFGAQLHEILAERMSRKSDFPLVDAIEQRFTPRKVDARG